ncbi:hypothetical protein UlMin_025148 [Ulmus minor]
MFEVNIQGLAAEYIQDGIKIDHSVLQYLNLPENISSSKQEARMLKNVTEIWKARYSTSNRIKSFQFKSKNIVSQPIMANINMCLWVHHDMSASLTHYFVYTGHNSYLTGNQLSSDRRDIPIIKVLLKGSIKEYAFVKSPYSVVITLEDHLRLKLQGVILYDHSNIWRNVVLPGGMPESLKHRIIISTKPPKEFLESISVKDKGSISHVGRESSEEEIAELDADDKSGLRNVLKLVDEKVRRLSLNEQALEKAAASYGSDLVRFTQRNLLRVYPKGIQATSSNYKPILGWVHGAQMVAFYMQGYDKSLWLMHGMFRANGGYDYVKKPDFLTQRVKVYMGDGWCKDFSQTQSHHRISTPRIEVRDYDRSEKDDFGGQTCLPVSELKSGFKDVPVYDKKGDKFKSVKLFMHFQFL